MSVVLPVFVFEGNDLSLCQSLKDVEIKLEGPDVEDGIFESFDSVGHRVMLTAQGVRRGWILVTPGQVTARS